MFEQSLFGDTKKYLAILVKEDILPEGTYLAGGTAIALQLGHRISYDLDFFTGENFEMEKILEKLSALENFKIDRTDWGTILGSFPNVKFSLFYYKYPLIENTIDFAGIKIASLQDLAASKIGAISSRGTKRDFVDIYYIIKNGNAGALREILDYYGQRFQNLASQKFHIIKSLTYFADADKEEDPKMLIADYSWEKVKESLTDEVRKLI